jgi:hypothetical protein
LTQPEPLAPGNLEFHTILKRENIEKTIKCLNILIGRKHVGCRLAVNKLDFGNFVQLDFVLIR